jgi:hypothetical protein
MGMTFSAVCSSAHPVRGSGEFARRGALQGKPWQEPVAIRCNALLADELFPFSVVIAQRELCSSPVWANVFLG